MTHLNQLSIWDIEYTKCHDKVSYILKYPYEENPFFYKALSSLLISSNGYKKLFDNVLGGCCKDLTIQDITPAIIRYAIEFNKCKNQNDYEKYFLKHNGETDNPFIIEAKNQINVRNNLAPLWLRLSVLLGGIVISLLFIWLAFLGDGTSSSVIGILCFGCILVAIVSFIAVLVFVFSPSTFIKNNK